MRRDGQTFTPEMVTPERAARFWSRVDKSGDCWRWTGPTLDKGYGSTSLRRMMIGAHVLAYVIGNGAVPVGLCVCHTCDNPPCCNPAHLFLGSYSDNMRDMHAKGRSKSIFVKKSHCLRGHEFTPENTYLRRRPDGTVFGQKCRACENLRLAHRIAYNRTWRDANREHSRAYQRAHYHRTYSPRRADAATSPAD